MTTDKIIDIITALGPYIIIVLTVVATIIKVFMEFRQLAKEFKLLHQKVNDNKEIKELNEKVGYILQENYELKKKLNELLTKIDHIERK